MDSSKIYFQKTNNIKLHLFLTKTGKHLSKIDKSAKILTSKKQQSTKNWSTRKWSTSLKSNLSIKVPLTNISLCLYKHTNNGISILYSVMHLRLKIMYQKQDRKTFFQMHYWRFKMDLFIFFSPYPLHKGNVACRCEQWEVDT